MATVKLFGALGDMAGWTDRQIDATTLGALKAQVASGDDRLGPRLNHPSILLIFNGTVIPHSLRGDDHPVTPADEVGFGPPVSGG